MKQFVSVFSGSNRKGLSCHELNHGMPLRWRTPFLNHSCGGNRLIGPIAENRTKEIFATGLGNAFQVRMKKISHQWLFDEA
jgi:hypothetical protein